MGIARSQRESAKKLGDSVSLGVGKWYDAADSGEKRCEPQLTESALVLVVLLFCASACVSASRAGTVVDFLPLVYGRVPPLREGAQKEATPAAVFRVFF